MKFVSYQDVKCNDLESDGAELRVQVHIIVCIIRRHFETLSQPIEELILWKGKGSSIEIVFAFRADLDPDLFFLILVEVIHTLMAGY